MSNARRGRASVCSRCGQLVGPTEARCPSCGAVSPTLGGFAPSLRALFRDTDVVEATFRATVGIYLFSALADYQSLFEFRGIFSLGAPSSRALSFFGMTGGPAWACGHIWTVLTATFLHGGLLHIYFNASWLRSLGPVARDLLGPARFVVLYLGSGITGFLLSNLVSGAPTIGASCSLFGLMGGLAVWGRRRGGTLGQSLSRSTLGWAASATLYSLLLPSINHWGHLGGFLGGALLGALFPRAEGVREARGVQLVALLLLVATALGFVASMVLMSGPVFRGDPVCAP